MELKYDHLLHFGLTQVGTKCIKKFTFNFEVEPGQWIVEQKQGVDVTLNTFKIKKKCIAVSKTDPFELLVAYNPVTPNQKHANYYVINGPKDYRTILCVKGESGDLAVITSVKDITLYRLKNDKKCKSIFELKNKSEISIKYQFDIDNNQNIFQIDPMSGEISPGKYENISVRFVIDEPGVFLMQIACLILHHEPKYVSILGVNALTQEKQFITQLKQSHSSLNLENGYERYMKQNFMESESKTGCYLSKLALDFGSKCSRNSQSSLLFELDNSTAKCMKIKWDIATGQPFNIAPIRKCLRPNERAVFEAKFEPNVLEQLYGACLYARAYSYETTSDRAVLNEPICFPEAITLRVIGNSFTSNNIWSPQIEITPKTVTLPVSSPEEVVYTTFIIRKFGQLPVVFKFLPPCKTIFMVKPMVGIITGDFQIFVVKFTSNRVSVSSARSYQETWSLQLNQIRDSIMQIEFKALVEIPKILVAEDDRVVFGNIYPGSKQFVTVPVVNLTQLSLRYTFFNNKWISVENATGDLGIYETVQLKLCYTADCDVPESFQLNYELSVLQNGRLIIGNATEGFVTVVARCSYTKLCATPSQYDFHEVLCGDRRDISFSIFNFGECEVHFVLKCHEHFTNSDEHPFTIEPMKASVGPHGNVKVNVSLLTYWSGQATYCIHYHVRESEDSDLLVPTIAETYKPYGIIFKMDYYSFYPTLKIVDIGKSTAGPLFGKLNIWEFFDGHRLNSVLRTIRAKETRVVHVQLPDAEAGLSIEKSMSFVVKNLSPIDTTCRFERMKICACEPQEVVDKISVRRYSYKDCPHREIINVTISDELIQAQSTQFMLVEVQYTLLDRQELCYLMRLSHERTVELRFHVTGLRPATLSIYTDHCTFNMHTVYLGELDPEHQIYWFYNNTRDYSSYCLDLGPMHALNKQYRTTVLSCLNPKGEVEPKSVHTVIFTFNPIVPRALQVDLPMDFGDNKYVLSVRGEGSLSYKSPLARVAGNGPIGGHIYYHPGLMVNISTEHVVVRALPTHCSTSRLITLRNVTKDRTVGFWFDRYNREHVVSVVVVPSTGILLPSESITLLMHIRAKERACAIRATTTCTLIDQTRLQKHVHSKTLYYQTAAMLHEQFEITAAGTKYPSPSIQIEPAPKVFHRTVAVSCYIVGIRDLDLKMSITQQLKQQAPAEMVLYGPEVVERLLLPRPKPQEAPIRTLHTDLVHQYLERKRKAMQNQPVVEEGQTEVPELCGESCSCSSSRDEVYVVIRTVLECLIRDILYSEKLKYYINEFNTLPTRYYAQYADTDLAPEEEKTMTKLILNRIPTNVLSKSLQYMIEDCLFSYYKLGVRSDIEEEPPVFQNKPKKSMLRDVYPEKFLFLFNKL